MNSVSILRQLKKRLEIRLARTKETKSSGEEQLNAIALAEIAALGELISDSDLAQFSRSEGWYDAARLRLAAKPFEGHPVNDVALLRSFVQRIEESTKQEWKGGDAQNVRFAALTQFLAITTEMEDDIDVRHFFQNLPSRSDAAMNGWLRKQIAAFESSDRSANGRLSPQAFLGAHRYLRFLIALHETLKSAKSAELFASGMWWYHGRVLTSKPVLQYLQDIARQFEWPGPDVLRFLSAWLGDSRARVALAGLSSEEYQQPLIARIQRALVTRSNVFSQASKL